MWPFSSFFFPHHEAPYFPPSPWQVRWDEAQAPLASTGSYE
jgi:hypothetical protein